MQRSHIPQDHGADALLHLGRIDADTGHKGHVDVVAVGLARLGMRGGDLELVERLQQRALGLRLQILVGGLLGDEVRVADDAAGEHAVVGDLEALGALGLAQVEVDLQVARRNELEVEGAQAVDLELEGEARLQVPVDLVLVEAVAGSVREVGGHHALVDEAHRQPPDALRVQQLLLGQRELVEQIGQRLVVDVLVVNACSWTEQIIYNKWYLEMGVP